MARLNRIATAAPMKRDTTPATPSQTTTKHKTIALPIVDSQGSTSASDSPSSVSTLTEPNTNTEIPFDSIPYKVVSKRFLPHGTSPGMFGAMSPDHRFICTLGSDGLVSILDATCGSLVGCLNFNNKRGSTSVAWITSTHIIIGCAGGYVLMARLVLESRLADGSRLTSVTDIGTCPKGGAPTALSFDPGLGLLAAVTTTTITIWRCILDSDSEHKRTWEQVEGGRGSLRSIGHTACFFGGHMNKFLFIGTNDRYALWSYQTKMIRWNTIGTYPVGRCVVSPGGCIMAATKSNFEVIIWPIQTSGICCSERSTFVIPTGREWITGATFPPVNFVDDNTIITANPVGNVYLVTARAEVVGQFSCGINYHIRSLFWTPAYLYALALGPGGTTVIANLTDNHSRFQSNYKHKAIDLTDGEPFVIQDIELPIPVAPGPAQNTNPRHEMLGKRLENNDHGCKSGFNHFLTVFENKIDLKFALLGSVLALLVLNYYIVIRILLTFTTIFGYTVLLILDFTLVTFFSVLMLFYKPNHGDFELSTEPSKMPQYI